MSLTFGPETLGVTLTPENASITVTKWDGSPVELTQGPVIDAQGRVSFTVSESGVYKITARRSIYNDYISKTVALSDGPDYDPSDIRSVTAYLLEQVEQSGGGTSTIDFVEVRNGDEQRPSVLKVFWQDFRVDQSIRPVNMGVKDIWITGGSPGPDEENPSVPTNLQQSNVTDTSFTVTWNASTDNVGVTSYDWRIDGGTITNIPVTPRTLNFTGRAPETAYTVELRSRDAADNVSNWASIVVTTEATAAPTEAFSLYGDTAPTGSWILGTDGTPTILFGRGFTSSAANAELIGGRLWIPAGATGIPTEVTLSVYGPNAAIGTTPVLTKVASLAGATAGSWVDIDFDATQAMSAGVTWMIAAQFTGASDAGKYVYGDGTRPNGDPVISSGPMGDELAWVAYSTGISSMYKIGSGSATQPGSYDQSYGIDIRVRIAV